MNLRGINLEGAKIEGANLSGARLVDTWHNSKKLWELRPILQLGIAGSRRVTTLVYFYQDKSEPMVKCGCFRGTIKEFSKKVKEKHKGTFYEYEYNAMIDYIKKIRKYQLQEQKED